MSNSPITIAVIGAGKMGLPLACAFAKNGARVLACDINAAAVANINAGIVPFDEPGVPELLKSVVESGNLSATTDIDAGIAASEVVVVIVPVMLNESTEAEMGIIDGVAAKIGKNLKTGSMVSFETTLPVGGTRRLGGLIEKAGGLVPGIDFDLVFSPERVKSQKVLKHLFEHPKVVGGITPAAAERAEAFYSTYLGAPVHNLGTLEASEFVKLAGMVYRDVNIALANELANYADAHNIDFDAVRAAANTDGEAAILIPGIGVGGHCTPVYPYFMIHEARSRQQPTPIAELSRIVNDAQPARYLDKLGDISGKSVAILGLAFRPQVKETAYSPAFPLRDELRKRGAKVTLNDPLYTDAEITHYGFTPSGLEGIEIFVLNTAHDAYGKLDFAHLAKAGLKAVVDGRGEWNRDEVESAGVRYLAMARSCA